MNEDDLRLCNYDHEDIGDLVEQLADSFQIKFDKDAFRQVTTFGELCDVFEKYIDHAHVDDCTSQQAFYKIRGAISQSAGIDKASILPDSELTSFFPAKGRRRSIAAFRQQLGLKIDLLTYADWLALCLVILFILSLLAFAISWKIALPGLALSILGFKLAEKFGNMLTRRTVRQLAMQATAVHYMAVRRVPGTVNRQEIVETIRDAFSEGLDLDKKYLTREEKLF